MFNFCIYFDFELIRENVRKADDALIDDALIIDSNGSIGLFEGNSQAGPDVKSLMRPKLSLTLFPEFR